MYSLIWLNSRNCVSVRACGVSSDGLTEIKTRSAPLMAESMSVEKNKFFPLHDSTTSFRPGWSMGKWKNNTGRVCQWMCGRNMATAVRNLVCADWSLTALYASHDDVIPCGLGWRREVAATSGVELINFSFSPGLSNTVQKQWPDGQLLGNIYCFKVLLSLIDNSLEISGSCKWNKNS